MTYPEQDELKEVKSEGYYIEKLEELFNNSIKLRLRADVPSGFYLSGGLDSSLIAMKIHEFAPGIQKKLSL
ncbi:hypothetical protein CS542_07220 [Pedobacter sp. IW39]|nr:hypothetical protein CS542_07220 [Pedobacter sp. IW39]